MSITIPTFGVVVSRFLAGFFCYTEDGTELKCRYPILPLKTQQVDVPSFFYERRNSLWDGNDVVHVKSPILTLKDRDSTNEYMVPGTYYSTLANYNFATRLVAYKYVGNKILFIYFDQSDGRYNYSFTTTIYTFALGKPRNTNYYVEAGYLATGWRVNRAGELTSFTSDRIGYSTLSRDLLLAEMRTHIHMEYGQPTPKREAKEFMEYIFSNSSWFMADGSLNERYSIGWTVSLVAPSSGASLEKYLAFDEFNLLTVGFSNVPYAAYFLNAAKQGAYLDALDKVPILNENSLGNIVEFTGFLKGIIIDHRIDIPRSLSSAWLSYRYAYTTTKLDVQEAVGFVRRCYGTDLLGTGISCYGRHVFDYKGLTVTVKCRLDVKQKELETLDKIACALYQYGLSPSFYAIWDMIPYSFIVDWFIPVGDILNGFDKTRMYERSYAMTNIWFSISYSGTDKGIPYSVYTRFGSDSLPEFQGYYTLENKGTASTKVLGYRILDSLSLLFR